MIQFLIAESRESPEKIPVLNQNWGRSATASSRRSAPLGALKRSLFCFSNLKLLVGVDPVFKKGS